MKRLLLDTQALLWWLTDDPLLGGKARASIVDANNPVWVSAASLWEIGIKKSLGKLTAPEDMDAIVEDEGFEKLVIDNHHAEWAPQLPPIHKDPFDRMLIAQAQIEGLTLVTADRTTMQYPVRVLACGK